MLSETYLMTGRFNSGSIDNFLKLLMVEVGYANGFDFTRVYQVFHTLHYLLYRNTIRLDLCYVREIQLNIITYKGAINFIQNEILKATQQLVIQTGRIYHYYTIKSWLI